MSLSYKEIAEIIKIIDASNCDELVIELPEAKIVVRRHNQGSTTPVPIVRDGAVSHFTSSQPSATPVPPSAKATVQRTDGLIEVASPMVGTFYAAPSPDKPPFVEVGATVKLGDPLCLIEVMKLFTTLNCEHEGRIAEILVDNGDGVQYGQPLFLIEPAS